MRVKRIPTAWHAIDRFFFQKKLFKNFVSITEAITKTEPNEKENQLEFKHSCSYKYMMACMKLSCDVCITNVTCVVHRKVFFCSFAVQALGQ